MTSIPPSLITITFSSLFFLNTYRFSSSVGDVLCDPEYPLRPITRFIARILVLDIRIPITKGFPVIFHWKTLNEQAWINQLRSLMNRTTGEIVKERPR